MLEIYRCRVCNNTENNISYKVKEKMFDLKDEFVYFQCAQCGCLQIKDYPSDLAKYYPSNYYSYSINKRTLRSMIVDFLMKQSLSYRINKNNIFGFIAILYNRFYATNLPCFSSKRCNYDSKILDIGCGAGDLLLKLSDFGFKHLFGADPFINADLTYANGVQVYKKSIFELDGVFDCIMLHHSFEHMPDPHRVFRHLKKILSSNGMLLIRIPLCDSYAFRKYGVDWWQLDAPRHFHLHTIKSISILAEQYNLIIDDVLFDSHIYQFIGSQKYKGILSSISKKNIKEYSKCAKFLNLISDGDQACFILRNK